MNSRKKSFAPAGATTTAWAGGHLTEDAGERRFQLFPKSCALRLTPLRADLQSGFRHGAQKVALRRCVWAGVLDQAIRDPAIEQPGLLQEFNEERQLTERG